MPENRYRYRRRFRYWSGCRAPALWIRRCPRRRRETTLEETAALAGEDSPHALPIVTDVTDADSVCRLRGRELSAVEIGQRSALAFFPSVCSFVCSLASAGRDAQNQLQSQRFARADGWRG